MHDKRQQSSRFVAVIEIYAPMKRWCDLI